MSTTNPMDEKMPPAQKALKPGAVSVAADEAARLDRRIASKLGADELESFEADVMAKEPRGDAPITPGAFSGSAFEQVAVKSTVEAARAPAEEQVPVDLENSLARDTAAMIEKKYSEENAMGKMMELAKEEPTVNYNDVVKKEEAPPAVADKELGMKENIVPEPMPVMSPVITTTADRGVVQEPDVEYGVYEPNEDGLAVAVAVTEEDEDVFIPSAVEYDPDAKPPLHRNRRVRLYGFLAFFALVACAVGATIGVVLGGDDGSAEIEVPPRERLGIRDLVERLVGQEKLGAYNSPYAKALNWIIHEDPTEPVPDDANFVQRYIMAYFYFATSVDKEWYSCNPPNVTLGHTEVCTFQVLANLRPVMYVTESRFRWLSQKHECEWAGVRCDGNNQVRALELSGQKMNGDFPGGLALLPFLQSFIAPLNALRGTIPSELGTMKHLVNLELHFNEITGSIPEELFNIRSLIRLNFGSNNLDGPLSSKIENLRDLKGLFLYDNALTGTIPTQVGSLQSLTFLRLAENQLRGTIPTEIVELKGLEELWLSDNDMSGVLPDGFTELTNLQEVRLRRNQRLGGRWPDAFWDNNQALAWLDIRDCNFTGTIGTGIGKMSNLMYFRLSSNPFSGIVPTEMASLTGMMSFWIDDTDITGTIPEAMCTSQTHNLFADINADCLGDSPEFECRCCTGCCLADGTGCQKMDD